MDFGLSQEQLLVVDTMVTDAVAELIIGVGRDPVLGFHLVVGAGGVLNELVGDRRVLMLPAGRGEIETALAALKVSALLRGYRGPPAGDVFAAVDAILAVQSYALAEGRASSSSTSTRSWCGRRGGGPWPSMR
ncbi:MAG: hypothetical protein FJX35_15645 [Alphaproteobacteria bacterium]|nr:hypothetical protein [Alphaproteobacteria bacterium]